MESLYKIGVRRGDDVQFAEAVIFAPQCVAKRVYGDGLLL
jgi:hypothetical protein